MFVLHFGHQRSLVELIILTLIIRTSINPAPSEDPPGEVTPPASAQLPVVTQIQAPTVLLFTINGVCGIGLGLANPTPAGNCPVNPDVSEGVPPKDPLTKL